MVRNLPTTTHRNTLTMRSDGSSILRYVSNLVQPQLYRFITQREDGQLHLMTILGWSSFDKELEMQQSILLDYLYDCLMVMVERGLPWQHVSLLFTVAQQLLTDCQGKAMADAVRLYQQMSRDCVQLVGQKNMEVFTQYIFSTFMTHYKLYQYVFSHNRDKLFTKLSLVVETPMIQQDFGESKELSVWEYENRYREIQQSAECEQAERERQRVEQSAQVTQQLKDMDTEMQERSPPLEREVLEKLIGQVAGVHICAASDSIKADIKGSHRQLQFQLQQNTLPRPEALGSPPKHEGNPVPASTKGARLASRGTRSSQSIKSGGSRKKIS